MTQILREWHCRKKKCSKLTLNTGSLSSTSRISTVRVVSDEADGLPLSLARSVNWEGNMDNKLNKNYLLVIKANVKKEWDTNWIVLKIFSTKIILYTTNNLSNDKNENNFLLLSLNDFFMVWKYMCMLCACEFII